MGGEKPSPYNSSTIDNNSAFTQPPGEEVQYSAYKKSRTGMYWKVMMVVMVMKLGPALRNQEKKEKKHLAARQSEKLNTCLELKSSLQFLREEMKE